MSHAGASAEETLRLTQQIGDAFKSFDVDRNGQITLAELKQIFQEIDPHMWTEEKCETLLQRIDRNRNGSVDITEFINYICDAKTSIADKNALISDRVVQARNGNVRAEFRRQERLIQEKVAPHNQKEDERAARRKRAEEDRRRRQAEAKAKVAAKAKAAGVDLELRVAAKQLRELRSKQRTAAAADMDTLRAKEAALAKRTQELWSQRREEYGGKLIVRGLVVSGGKEISDADVELSLVGESVASTSTDAEGKFELSMDAQLGRRITISAHKKGFSTVTRRLGGEGMRVISLELLPVAVCESFDAEHGVGGTIGFRLEGANFDLPVGELLKDGEPFTGRAEFSARVINPASNEARASMPPLCGRSAGGAMVPFQSLGTVFTSLIDPSDGKELTPTPDGHGIYVSFPSPLALPRATPSIWHYNKSSGQWQQSMQPVLINGSEFEAPDADQALSNSAAVVEDGLVEEQKSKNNELQSARERLDEQREQSGELKVCTCGFEAKNAIMPIVHERFGLKHASPPKRVFASTDLDEKSCLCFAFPYLTEDEKISSAERASLNPEVIFSHHLGNANATMNTHSTSGKMRTKYFATSARDSLPSLLHVIEYLLNGARLVDEETQEAIDEMNWSLIHLKALQKLASFWVQGTSRTPCPSLAELKEALEEYSFFGSGPDANAVAEAYLSVAARQALLEDVALVREKLKQVDKRRTAMFHEVEHALDSADGEVDRAVELLLEDPVVSMRLKKLKVREELYQKLPMAHPTSRQVEDAVAAAGGNLDKAADLLKANPDVQEGAKKVYETWRETLGKANKTNDFGWQIYNPGWNSLGSYVDLCGAIEAYGIERVVLEFYPAEPRRVCPIGDSSMVLGSFDDGIFAVKATAVNLEYSGVNYSEDVQPDGSFCLTTFARGQFEVQTTKMDGTASFSYGPFNPIGRFADLRRNDVIHLGLLEPPRRIDDVSELSLASDVKVVLPVLEFPNKRTSYWNSGPEDEAENWSPKESFRGEWSYTIYRTDCKNDEIIREFGFTNREGIITLDMMESAEDAEEDPRFILTNSCKRVWDEECAIPWINLASAYDDEEVDHEQCLQFRYSHKGKVVTKIHISTAPTPPWIQDHNRKWRLIDHALEEDPLPSGILHVTCLKGLTESKAGDRWDWMLHFDMKSADERCTCFDNLRA